MTKADIIDRVLDELGGLSRNEAAAVVELVFEVMKETLAVGKPLKILGFGTFVVRAKNPRLGRNPQTGEQLVLEARRVLKFKPSALLKAAVNS